MMDVAAAHRSAEHTGKALEELRPSAAGQTPALPITLSTDESFERVVEAAAIAGVVNEMDVEAVDRAVPRGVGDQGTTCAAAMSSSCRHPAVVVLDIAAV